MHHRERGRFRAIEITESLESAFSSHLNQPPPPMPPIHERSFQTLQSSLVNRRTLLVTLHRPSVANALDTVMTRELLEIWQQLFVEPDSCRAVILSGSGERAFCAGADLKERSGIGSETWLQQHAVLEQMMLAMHGCPVPVIAAVNGAAYGGGLELVLNCDFAYGTPNARFAFPETKLGFIPGAMGTQWLPRAVGLARAKEICLTGRPFTAEEALEWGLLNRIVAPEELIDAVTQCAADIESRSPLAGRQVKQALNATLGNDIVAGYQQEIALYNRCIESGDRTEGVAAFIEKRPPRFG